MALLKLSGIVTQISGRIGGQITGTSKNGSYIKNNSYSQQSNTPKQSAQRNKINTTNKFWNTLTQAQKNDWISETVNYPYTNRVGDEVFYTGYQLFNKLNSNLILIGESLLTTPNPFDQRLSPTMSIANLSTTAININITGQQSPVMVVMYATRPMPSNYTVKQRDFQLFRQQITTQVSQNVNVRPQYIANFPTPLVGEKITFKFKAVNTSTGQTTEIYNTLSGIVV